MRRISSLRGDRRPRRSRSIPALDRRPPTAAAARSTRSSGMPPTRGTRSSGSSSRAPGCRRTTSAATSDASSRSGFTSPTNIGMYLWATIAARDLGLIGRREATPADRARRSTSIEQLERHEPSGQFYNWYDPATLEKLTIWPENGRHRLPVPVQRRQRLAGRGAADGRQRRAAAPRPGLGAGHEHGLRLLLRPARQGRGHRRPDPRRVLDRLIDRAGCGRLPARRLLRHGRGRRLHRPPLRRVQHRAAHRLATSASPSARSRAEHYFGPWRTFPDTCDWSWHGAASRSASGRRTSASTCSRAPTATTTS